MPTTQEIYEYHSEWENEEQASDAIIALRDRAFELEHENARLRAALAVMKTDRATRKVE